MEKKAKKEVPEWNLLPPGFLMLLRIQFRPMLLCISGQES